MVASKSALLLHPFRAMVLVEACVDSVESALAAERGGAMRLELCAALHDGGTTPSAGMIDAVVHAVRIPVCVLVRPRGGDFVYSRAERAVIDGDVATAASLGAAGIVAGFLDARGAVDEEATRALVRQAGGLSVTFHRAFDLAANLHTSLETLVRCGVARVLTSGGAGVAANGLTQLAALVDRARDRIGVMAGGGVREENVAAVVRTTAVREVHVRGPRLVPGAEAPRSAAITLRKPLPERESAWEETDAERVAAIVRLANDALPGAGATPAPRP